MKESNWSVRSSEGTEEQMSEVDAWTKFINLPCGELLRGEVVMARRLAHPFAPQIGYAA